VWHTFTNNQDATLNEIAESFNASQNYATIVVQSQPYQDFLNNVRTAVREGVGPNIIFDYPSTAADYVADGLVADLGKYIDDPEIGIENFSEALRAAIYKDATGFADGKIHYLPLVTTGPILFYNKTLYDDLGLNAPATWTELAENSKKIFEAKGIPGFGVDSIVDTIQALIIQNGSGYIDVASKSVLFNNEKAIERVTWFIDNINAGYFSLNPSGDYWSNDFNAGLTAMYIGSCAGVPYIAPDGFEYGVAPIPQEGGVKWYPAWNRGMIVFAAEDAVERAAYEFAKFYASPENNLKWCKSMIALSPYVATLENDEYVAFVSENPALITVDLSVQYAGFLPSVTGAYTVRTELTRAIREAAGGADIAGALAAAEAAGNEALRGE
jgi:ABC-type glycerol-3-phosphate transport system substrate-binding protein